jgi:hypothetical protein
LLEDSWDSKFALTKAILQAGLHSECPTHTASLTLLIQCVVCACARRRVRPPSARGNAAHAAL